MHKTTSAHEVGVLIHVPTRVRKSGCAHRDVRLASELRALLLRVVLAIFGVIALFFPRTVTDDMIEVTTTGEPTYVFKP